MRWWRLFIQDCLCILLFRHQRHSSTDRLITVVQ
jgi:hypothetical protein